MRRMTTLKDHGRRITALERNAGEVKVILASHSESIYRLRRESIENSLYWQMLVDHFGLPRITQGQVDEVLDAE